MIVDVKDGKTIAIAETIEDVTALLALKSSENKTSAYKRLHYKVVCPRCLKKFWRKGVLIHMSKMHKEPNQETG